MNNLLKIGLVFFIIFGCKSKKELPVGSPPVIKLKTLLENIQNSENDFENLRVKTTANFKDASNSQNFRLEIRMLRDSLIWLDIADPILGLKVARAVVFEDSVAFVQHLPDKQFYTGKLADLQSKFDIGFGFKDLQKIFAANVLFDLSKEFEIFYEQGNYLLSDFDPKRQGNFGKEEFRQVRLKPEFYKPEQQNLRKNATNRNYVISNKNFQQENDLIYPDEMSVFYSEKEEETTLSLDVKSFERNDSRLNFPFNIPSGYAKIRL